MSLWSIPGAKRVLGANASRDSRVELLHHYLNSFDAAAAAGTNPFLGALGLYERKTAPHPPRLTPAQIATGDAIPRLVRTFHTRHPDVATQRVGVLVPRDTSQQWLASRPTALTSDGGLLIITTTHEGLGHEWTAPALTGTIDDLDPDTWAEDPGASPDVSSVHPALMAIIDRHAMPSSMTTRVIYDLMITGAAHAYVLCEIHGHDDSEIVERRVDRDEPGMQDAMRALHMVLHDYWTRHIATGIAPQPTRGDRQLLVQRRRLSKQDTTVTATTKQLRALAHRLRLTRRIKELEERVAGIDVSIMAAMGDARAMLAPDAAREANKTRLVKWENTATFATAAFERDNPDLARRHTRTETVTGLDMTSLLARDEDAALPYFSRPFCCSQSQKTVAVLTRLAGVPPI